MKNSNKEELSLSFWRLLASLNFSQLFQQLDIFKVYYRGKKVILIAFLLQKNQSVWGNKNPMITEMDLVYFESAADILKETLALNLEREIKKNYDKKIKSKWGPQEECFIRDTPTLLTLVYLKRSLFWQLEVAKE